MDSPGWQALYNAILAISSDMSAVVSEGTKINMLESNFRAAALHKTHLEACTTSIVVNWLGGELGTTSKSGSGTLAGGAQAQDLDDMIRDDCDWLTEILNEQIASDAIARRFPGQAVLARILVRKPDADDDTADMATLKGAVELGARVPASYVHDRFGLPEAAEDEPVLVPDARTTPAAPAAAASDPAAAASGEAVQDTAAIQEVALNGAQVQSLLEVIQQVALRQLPRETAVQIVTSAFGIDAATADSLLGPVGTTFFVDAQALANARGNAAPTGHRPQATGNSHSSRVRDRRPDLDQLVANSMQPVGAAYAALLQPLLERLDALPADAPAGDAASLLDAYEIPDVALDAMAETMARVSFCAAMMGGEPIRASLGSRSTGSAFSPATGHRPPATGHRANATGVGDYAPLPFEEARAFWAAKDMIQEFAGDEAQLDIWIQSRVTGFKVAGLTSDSLLRQAHADLERAVKGEESAAKVARTLRDKYGLGAKHAETVVRTNVQSAYSWGNWQQLSAPSVVEAFPLLAFDVTEDERTSGICAPLAGKAYPREHPIWISMYPPNHYNCRTTVYPTTAEEAEEDGYEVMAADAPLRTGQGYEILPDKSFVGNIGTGRLADAVPTDGIRTPRVVSWLKDRVDQVFAGDAKRTIRDVSDAFAEAGIETDFAGEANAAVAMRSYLEEMKRLATERGMVLPKSVRVNPDLENNNPMRRVGDTLQINPRHPALSASGQARDVANARGGVLRTHTTGSGHHFVRHELVHFSHTAVPAYADVQEFAALEDFRRTYGDRLGLGYAFSQTDSTKLYREFVAEIGAGLIEGRTYDDTVMEWYRRLGGPAL